MCRDNVCDVRYVRSSRLFNSPPELIKIIRCLTMRNDRMKHSYRMKSCGAMGLMSSAVPRSCISQIVFGPCSPLCITSLIRYVHSTQVLITHMKLDTQHKIHEGKSKQPQPMVNLSKHTDAQT